MGNDSPVFQVSGAIGGAGSQLQQGTRSGLGGNAANLSDGAPTFASSPFAKESLPAVTTALEVVESEVHLSVQQWAGRDAVVAAIQGDHPEGEVKPVEDHVGELPADDFHDAEEEDTSGLPPLEAASSPSVPLTAAALAARGMPTMPEDRELNLSDGDSEDDEEAPPPKVKETPMSIIAAYALDMVPAAAADMFQSNETPFHTPPSSKAPRNRTARSFLGSVSSMLGLLPYRSTMSPAAVAAPQPPPATSDEEVVANVVKSAVDAVIKKAAPSEQDPPRMGFFAAIMSVYRPTRSIGGAVARASAAKPAAAVAAEEAAAAAAKAGEVLPEVKAAVAAAVSAVVAGEWAEELSADQAATEAAVSAHLEAAGLQAAAAVEGAAVALAGSVEAAVEEVSAAAQSVLPDVRVKDNTEAEADGEEEQSVPPTPPTTAMGSVPLSDAVPMAALAGVAAAAGALSGTASADAVEAATAQATDAVESATAAAAAALADAEGAVAAAAGHVEYGFEQTQAAAAEIAEVAEEGVQAAKGAVEAVAEDAGVNVVDSTRDSASAEPPAQAGSAQDEAVGAEARRGAAEIEEEAKVGEVVAAAAENGQKEGADATVAAADIIAAPAAATLVEAEAVQAHTPPAVGQTQRAVAMEVEADVTDAVGTVSDTVPAAAGKAMGEEAVEVAAVAGTAGAEAAAAAKGMSDGAKDASEGAPRSPKVDTTAAKEIEPSAASPTAAKPKPAAVQTARAAPAPAAAAAAPKEEKKSSGNWLTACLGCSSLPPK